MGLADELLEVAEHLTEKGISENGPSYMRRAVSTAYYAVFHLFIEDFVANWPFAEQRARLARMFDHNKMGKAAPALVDSRNPTPLEAALVDIATSFAQLQQSRRLADYDISWEIVDTKAVDVFLLAQDTFAKWRSIRSEPAARNYLLAMFGANR